MLILGDIACPTFEHTQKLNEFFTSSKILVDTNTVLFNLEGQIIDNDYKLDAKPILFNHISILQVFNNCKNKITALANNHILDFSNNLLQTKEKLKKAGYKTIGAGNINDYDFEVISFIEDDVKVYVINACWEFLLYNQNNNQKNSSVNVINEQRILNLVKNISSNEINYRIITFFHWSLDFELLPFPSYRTFAKKLIDFGVSLVIGSHSHCIQGGEKYKNGYMIYGLGNMYIPNGFFAKGKLLFPDISDVGLAIRWNLKENTITNHWINVNELKLIAIDEFENSDILKQYTPYNNLSDMEYIKYFKKSRRKRFLIPIFYNFNETKLNKIKMLFLVFRAKIARFAAELNLIKWTN